MSSTVTGLGGLKIKSTYFRLRAALDLEHREAGHRASHVTAHTDHRPRHAWAYSNRTWACQLSRRPPQARC
eukprot:7390746-Prymnesium_polylepis.1